MKRIFIILSFILFTAFCYGQDLIKIKHTNYTTTFSRSKHYPVLVEWWETKAKVGCSTPIARKDQFQKDPLLPQDTNLGKDYLNCGYDKGHMCPAADNECLGDKVLTECFYFSNLIPQPHYSNAGPWKMLETLTRQISLQQDSIHIWAGAVGVVKVFGLDKVAVPSKTWKVIYVVKTKTYYAYIFPNTTEKISSLNAVMVKKEAVESLTGFKFN